jgi:hypothetical protein
MAEWTEEGSSRELAVVDRAKSAVQYDELKAKIAELAGKYTDIEEVKDDTDRKLVHQAYMSLRSAVVEVEKRGKTAREDAIALQKTVIQVVGELCAPLVPERDRLKRLRDDYDQIEKRRLEELEAKEAERIEKIQSDINIIRNYRQVHASASMEDIERCLDELSDLAKNIREINYAEFTQEAEDACTASIQHCLVVRDQRKAYDAEQAELEATRKRQAEEEARLQAERDALEKERRAHEDEQRVREEADNREKERVETIRTEIRKIKDLGDRASVAEPSDDLLNRLDRLRHITVEPEVFQEFTPFAIATLSESRRLVGEALRDREEFEKEQCEMAEARRKAEQEQLEKEERDRLEWIKQERLEREERERPDREKILRYVDSMLDLEVPQLEDEGMLNVLTAFLHDVGSSANHLYSVLGVETVTSAELLGERKTSEKVRSSV